MSDAVGLCSRGYSVANVQRILRYHVQQRLARESQRVGHITCGHFHRCMKPASILQARISQPFLNTNEWVVKLYCSSRQGRAYPTFPAYPDIFHAIQCLVPCAVITSLDSSGQATATNTRREQICRCVSVDMQSSRVHVGNQMRTLDSLLDGVIQLIQYQGGRTRSPSIIYLRVRARHFTT